MFKLENAISAWRNELFRAGLSSAAVFELESHLRDDIARQMESGVDAESAFHTAVRNLGAAAKLGPEFQKMYRLNSPLLWPYACFISFTFFVIALNVYVGEVTQEFDLIYCLLFSLGMVVVHPFFAGQRPEKESFGPMFVTQMLLALYAIIVVISSGILTSELAMPPIIACVLMGLRLLQKRREAARRISSAK